jgi:hypothetical protein
MESGSRSAGRATTRFGSQDLLADSAECLFFLTQDLPCYLESDLSLAKLLNHAPNQGAVLVGPLMKGVRGDGNYSTRLHLGMLGVFLVIINGQKSHGLSARFLFLQIFSIGSAGPVSRTTTRTVG